jgi:hypothetical protein
MDIFRVIRVTWLPRTRAPEPSVRTDEPGAKETPAEDAPGEQMQAAGESLTAADDTLAAGEVPAPEGTPAVEPPPDMIRDLIGLADDLLALTGKAPDAGSSPRTLHLLQRRVDRLLNDCGVQILGENGPVLASRHQVVGVQPPGADDTEGWIASTVRRGYMHGDRLIRPQQVVAYAAGSPARIEGRNDDEG